MYTLGIEQEFYVLDAKNYELVLLNKNQLLKIFGENIKQESYQFQIEINTPICNDINQLESEHQKLLTHIHECAHQHGLLILIGSTPLVPIDFKKYPRSSGSRLTRHFNTFQKTIEAFVCCSLQFHVQSAHLNRRFPLINYLRPYLPIFLALTTNSPFWEGGNTGLKSYRAQIFQSTPHTGLPPHFNSMNDLSHYTAYLKKVDSIKTQKDLWWDIQPHHKYPTLECRICDNVFESRHAIAIAALYQALVYQIESLMID